MKKIFNILFVFVAFLSFLGLKEGAIALEAGKMFVSPVSVPTPQSSYGVYPNTLDMVANDIINSINKYSSFDVPDINSTKDLVQSYGMAKHYKEFLMNYRDNRVVDYKFCNQLSNKLGIDKILLVSGGYDVQNLFLNKSESSKSLERYAAVLPFTRIFSKDLVTMGFPFIYKYVKNSVDDTSPINPCYKLNIQLSLIDTETGLSLWEKTYNQDIPASDFGNPINSFGENIISSDKLKKFSEKISRETSYEVFMATKNSEYTTVKSSIVSSQAQSKDETVQTVNKTLPRDGKMTRDGQPSSLNNNYLEKNRKESYKNWVKERAKY